MLLLFAYIALLLLPLSFVLGVGAPSLSLVGFMIKAVRRGSLSFSLFVVASAACACTRRDCCLLVVCACRTSAASVEPLPRGSRAVAFPLWLQVLRCSTWLIVRCSLLHQLFLLCFGFIGATSWPPQNTNFFASICHANTDPPVTKIRLWASFGV